MHLINVNFEPYFHPSIHQELILPLPLTVVNQLYPFLYETCRD